MPQKEHLTFESTTPAFLRRLRGEAPSGPPGSSTDPDRHATPQLRTRKPRDAATDLEDEPVYVDAGTGETLSSVEVGELKGAPDADEKTVVAADGKVSKEDAKARVKSAMHVGSARKKREVAVVGGGEEEGDEENVKDKEEKSTKSNPGKDAGGKESKTRRKTKKIKLSFDDG